MPTTIGSDPSAERSEKICEFARAKMAAGMHEAAFALFAQALQTLPSSVSALNGLLDCGSKIGEQAATSAMVKSLRKDFAQIGDIAGDFLDSLVLTAVQPSRKDYALSSCDRAFRAGFPAIGRLLAERALSFLSNAERQSSDDYFAIANSAFGNRLYDLAERAAQTAADLDPGSSAKKSFHKNATAARIIEERKLEKSETRYVDNLYNPSTQHLLQMQERPVSSAEELEQLITSARTEHAQKKEEKGKISKLVSLLEKRGQTSDIEEATSILTAAFERTSDPSFRQRLADLHLRPLESALKAAQRAQSLQREQSQLRLDVVEKRRTYLVARCAEFEKRAMEYPTEPAIRLELGEMLLHLNRCNEAIPHLQAGRADMKQRSRAWRLLGMAFIAIAYWDEAAWCLEESAKHAEQDPTRQLEAKLGLGRALLELYSKKSDRSYLDRARQIILEIVVEDFTYPGAAKLRAMLAKAMAEEPVG
jgi:tetratricopeptide (TPR) repeat protein